MTKKKRLLIAIPVALALGGGVYGYRAVRPSVNPNELRVSGNIEVTDVEVSFRTPGWVEARLVSEGDIVQADAPVARLDRREFEHEVAIRKAEADVAEAKLQELEAGSRPEEISQAEAAAAKAKAFVKEQETGSRPQEILAAQAAVEGAAADTGRLDTDYKRYKQLWGKEAISTRQYEQAQSTYAVASARLAEAQERLKLVKEGPRAEDIAQAKAALSEAQARLELARNGPRRETIQQARAHVDEAKQVLALADTRLGYAEIHAPISGVVLADHVESGEYVMPGTPVVTIGDLEHVWLRAFIDESDLGRVKTGQSVRVYTDSFPEKPYPGRISFISSESEFTPKNIQTEKERVKLVYRIKIDIANPEMELKPGMPADAVIELMQGATQ